MTLLERVDLIIDLLLRVLYRLIDLVSLLVRLLGRDALARLLHLSHSIFSIAPSLSGRPGGLIHNSLIGQLFAPHGFSHALLYLPHLLPNLTGNLILIHCTLLSPPRQRLVL